MEIVGSSVVNTERRHSVLLEYDNKEWYIFVRAINGVVEGDFQNNISTAKLIYFEYPEDVREKHFKEIKDYVEIIEKELVL